MIFIGRRIVERKMKKKAMINVHELLGSCVRWKHTQLESKSIETQTLRKMILCIIPLTCCCLLCYALEKINSVVPLSTDIPCIIWYYQ